MYTISIIALSNGLLLPVLHINCNVVSFFSNLYLNCIWEEAKPYLHMLTGFLYLNSYDLNSSKEERDLVRSQKRY